MCDLALGVAKVAELERGPRAAGMPVKERVFELKVAVDDALAVAVVDGDDELLEEPPRLRLLNPLLLHDVVKGVAAVGVLHGNAEKVLGQENLLQLHNVWMQEQPAGTRACRE